MTTTPRRSAKAAPTKIPLVQSPEQVYQSELERRFGKALMINGFLGAPNLVRELALDKEHIGMTRTELLMWECIISKQRNNRPPWPSIETIAGMMQCSIRTVQRYIRRLENKELLQVKYGVLNEQNNYTNQYDFTPLYKRIIALYDLRQAELAAKVEALRQQGLSVQNTQGDTFVGGGDTFVANGATKPPSNFIIPTKLEPDRDPETPPNEDHDQEKDEKRYDSRSRTDKEAFDYNTSDVPDDYTNPLNSTYQPGNHSNDGYNDEDAYNEVDQRNRNRDRTNVAQSAGPGGNSVTSGDGSDNNIRAVQFRASLEEQQWLRNFMNDTSREFHDNEASFAPNVSRLTNIYQVFVYLFEDIEAFAGVVYEARGAAKRAKVQKKNDKGKVNRVPYFFTVLEGLLVEMHQSYLLSIRE